MSTTTTTTYIELEGMKFYAYHGVLPQEQVVGNHYIVYLKVGYPFEAAMHSDELADTLNYASIYALVKQEIAIPSKLLEHVAGRILTALHDSHPQITTLTLKVTKLTPPISGDIAAASVSVTQVYS